MGPVIALSPQRVTLPPCAGAVPKPPQNGRGGCCRAPKWRGAPAGPGASPCPPALRQGTRRCSGCRWGLGGTHGCDAALPGSHPEGLRASKSGCSPRGAFVSGCGVWGAVPGVPELSVPVQVSLYADPPRASRSAHAGTLGSGCRVMAFSIPRASTATVSTAPNPNPNPAPTPPLSVDGGGLSAARVGHHPNPSGSTACPVAGEAAPGGSPQHHLVLLADLGPAEWGMSQRPCSPFSSSGGCPTCVGQCRCLGPQLTRTLAGQTRKLQAQASPGWLWGGEHAPDPPSMERARTPAQPLLPKPGGVLRELAPCRERGAAGAAPGASFLGLHGFPGLGEPLAFTPLLSLGGSVPIPGAAGCSPSTEGGFGAVWGRALRLPLPCSGSGG